MLDEERLQTCVRASAYNLYFTAQYVLTEVTIQMCVAFHQTIEAANQYNVEQATLKALRGCQDNQVRPE